MAFIQMEHVSKFHVIGGESIVALNDISLHIQQGEFVAIIGPSGSGKSTLMNILGCLDVSDSGNYYLDDREISTLKDNQIADIRNEKIGFVFQQFNLLSKLSAFENVELPLLYRGMNKKERTKAVMSMLQLVGLQERKDHKPTELSGGQQQRVAIARALAGDPPILLADEPTGSLDTNTGLEILRLLKALNGRGKTIILITHDLSIAGHADRIIRILDGQIIETTH